MKIHNSRACLVYSNLGALISILERKNRFHWEENNENLILDLNIGRFNRQNEPAMSFIPEKLKNSIIGPEITSKSFLNYIPTSGKSTASIWGGNNPWSFPNQKAKGQVTEAIFRMLMIALKIYVLPIKHGPDNGIDSLCIVPDNGKLIILSIDCKQKGTWQYNSLMRADGICERIKNYVDRDNENICPDTKLLLNFLIICLESLENNTEILSKPPLMIFGGIVFPSLEKKEGFQYRIIRETLIIDGNVSERKLSEKQTINFDFSGAISTLTTILNEISVTEEAKDSHKIRSIPIEGNCDLLNAGKWLSKFRFYQTFSRHLNANNYHGHENTYL